MIIAVASGKGGTGKTTVCAALADIWPEPAHLVDLDVEEPNLHLFLRPEITGTYTANLEVPLVDEEKCTHCGACAEICQFKAIAHLGDLVLTFNEMCHGCGGCFAVCPADAIKTGTRELGEVICGWAGDNRFLMGRSRVGEAMSPPLMRQVLAALEHERSSLDGDVIVDCPPGVSCPAVTAVSQSDLIVLVAEPTPFGFYDFKLAHEAFTPLNKPMVAVINRADLGNSDLEDYCLAQGIPVLAKIPFEREAAQAYASGELISQATPAIREIFSSLPMQLKAWARGAKEAANA